MNWYVMFKKGSTLTKDTIKRFIIGYLLSSSSSRINGLKRVSFGINEKYKVQA